MSMSDRPNAGGARRGAILAIAMVSAMIWATSAQAQFLQRTVGGVSINTDGILSNVDVVRSGEFDKVRLQGIPDGLKRNAALRWVSLKGLDAFIGEQLKAGNPLPEAAYYLAGLQQIRYVLVYPNRQDIVVGGPAQAWKLDRRGNIVGAVNGRPVMLLDDLLIALRAALAPVRSPMSCSIDPTPEGMQRLSVLFKRHLTPDPRAMSAAIEEQLGPQKISVNGILETSHFARVMVAADYRMKRISMGLERAPIQGLPSFMEMRTASAGGGTLPRWWLEPNYEGLLRDDAGLSWEIRGGAVKAMTENDYFDANGIRHPSGKADAGSQRWADTMTRRYDDLALAEPVFGQLRNCMDLAVVAALIAKENLAAKAGNQFPRLAGNEGIQPVKLEGPKQVASQAIARKAKKWMIAAGGVSINPWAIVDKAKTSSEVAAVRDKSAKDTTSWWWD